MVLFAQETKPSAAPIVPAVGENAPPVIPPKKESAQVSPDETKNPPPIAPAAPAKFRSFFFGEDDLNLMQKAKALYGRQGLGDSDIYDEEDLLNQLKGIKIVDKELEDVDVSTIKEKFYTQFYLESLVYHAPNDWVVWVQQNDVNQKLLPNSSASPDVELKIVGTKKEEVVFEWKPINWTRISAAYKEGASDIILDSARGVVVFTLRTNQTFDSQEMTIKEGPVPLVAMETDKKEAGEKTDNLLPDIFSEGIKKEDVLPDQKSNKGISGLINNGKKIEEMEKRL